MPKLHTLGLALIVILLSGCGGPESDMVGTWESPNGTSIEITKDGKWIAHMGLMQLNLSYAVENVAGKNMKIRLYEGAAKKGDSVPISVSVSGKTMTISDSNMWNGTFTRKS